MINLIDNTTLHCLYRIISKKKNQSYVISTADLLTILHFAELIMFSDEMVVSSFSIPEVWGVTDQVINILKNEGWVDEGKNQDLLLSPINFSKEAYSNACDSAADDIEEFLKTCNNDKLRQLGSLSNESSRVEMKSKIPPILKWMTQEFKKNDLESIKSRALNKKAAGSYDYIISKNKNIYKTIKEKSKYLNKNDLYSVSNAIGVIFRTYINEHLAGLVNTLKSKETFYSPAPQRGKIVYKGNELFRLSLSNNIVEQIKKEKGNFQDNWIELIQRDEKIPIPVFAICCLQEEYKKKRKKGNLITFFETARALRDSRNIKSLRSYFNKFQTPQGMKDYVKGANRVYSEINYMIDSINLKSKKNYSLFSIFSPISNFLTGKYFKCLEEVGKSIGHTEFFKALLNPRRHYISTLAKKLAFEKALIRDIMKMTGLELT
jgi:hypothetical protein